MYNVAFVVVLGDVDVDDDVAALPPVADIDAAPHIVAVASVLPPMMMCKTQAEEGDENAITSTHRTTFSSFHPSIIRMPS